MSVNEFKFQPHLDHVMTEINMETLLERYPIRNSAWDCDGGWRTQPASALVFMAEASDFKEAPLLDPWNRVFPTDGTNSPVFDSENEITGWDFKTSVHGTEIICHIFND